MPQAYKQPECHFCGKLMLLPLHVRFNGEGEPIDCCEECYEIAKLFVKGKKYEHTGRSTEDTE